MSSLKVFRKDKKIIDDNERFDIEGIVGCASADGIDHCIIFTDEFIDTQKASIRCLLEHHGYTVCDDSQS